MGPCASSANHKSVWVASNGSRKTENKTRKYNTKLVLEKKNGIKKTKKKLNKKIVASTKVLKNRGE